MFRSRLLGELFLRLFSFLHWSSPDYFRASHVRHHQYTVHDELDREVQLPRPFQPLQWLFRFVAAVPNILAELKPLLRWSFGRLAGEGRTGNGGGVTWEQHCFADRPLGQGDAAKRAALFGWARVVLLGHLALAVLFIAFDAWILLLVVTLGALAGTVAELPAGGDPALRPAVQHARPPRMLPHRGPRAG